MGGGRVFARKYNRHVLNAWMITTKGAQLLIPPLLYSTESKETGDNQDRQANNLLKKIKEQPAAESFILTFL